MARHPGNVRSHAASDRARRDRALLAAATAVAFGRVFIGHGVTLASWWWSRWCRRCRRALERRNLAARHRGQRAGRCSSSIGLSVFPDTTWFGLPTLDTLAARAGAARPGRRAGAGPGRAHRRRCSPCSSRPSPAIVGRDLLGPCAGVPRGEPAAGPAASGRAGCLRRHGARGVRQARVRRACSWWPASRVVFADALRRVQGWGPVWAGPGAQAPALVHGRPGRAAGRRRRGGCRDRPRPLAGPRVRLDGDLRPLQPRTTGPGPDRSRSSRSQSELERTSPSRSSR